MPKNPKRRASEAQKIHPTAGFVFSDGSILEIVRRNPSSELEVLAWNDPTFEVGSTAGHGGKLYSPRIAADARSHPIYKFPRGAGPDLPRGTVINHNIPGMLHCERPWEGFLLGTCNRPLPKDVGARLAAKVVMYDDFGKAATSDIDLVNHTTWASVGKLKKRRGLGLFEPEEGESFRPPARARTQEEDDVPKSERKPKGVNTLRQ